MLWVANFGDCFNGSIVNKRGENIKASKNKKIVGK